MNTTPASARVVFYLKYIRIKIRDSLPRDNEIIFRGYPLGFFVLR